MTEILRKTVEARRLPPPATKKLLRQNAGLSLASLAQHVGVSAMAVWYWEADLRTPRGSNRVRYAAALNELKELL